MDRGAWRAAVHGVTKSRTRLSPTNTPRRLLFYNCSDCFLRNSYNSEERSWSSTSLKVYLFTWLCRVLAGARGL